MKADDESFTGIDGLIKTVPTPKKTLAEKRQDAFDFISKTRTAGKRRGRFTLPREMFDPTNTNHLYSYKRFLDTNNWGDIQFHVEYPYETVIETVTRRFAQHVLEQTLDNPHTYGQTD